MTRDTSASASSTIGLANQEITVNQHRGLAGLLWLSVALLYAVILAGATVRASGSGMGCPDWPLCFDRYIPPTSVEQIPEKYMHQFLTEGHGNLFHTWVEFLNRLLGAVSGFAILLSLLWCLFLAATRKAMRNFYLKTAGIIALGMVCFAVVAWLGKVVVATSLDPRKITIHMLGGLILTAAAIVARLRVSISPASRISVSPGLRRSLFIMLGLTAVQLVLGARVREVVDQLPPDACCDGRLESRLLPYFNWHWVGAILTTLGTIMVTRGASRQGVLKKWLMLPVVLVVLEYVVGVLLVKLALPPIIQPMHLVLASFLMGAWLVCVHVTVSADREI